MHYPTLTHIGVTSRSGSAIVSWATPECFPDFEIALQKVDNPSIFLFLHSHQNRWKSAGA